MVLNSYVLRLITYVLIDYNMIKLKLISTTGGDNMTDYEKITKIALEHSNLFKTKMVVEAGIRKEKIREMLECGYIERVGHGLYSLCNEDVDEYYEFQQRCPKGIFSYGTSAYFWNLSDRVPNVLNCTVPRGYNTSRLKIDTKVKYHYVPKELYDVGVIEITSPQGAKIRVYNRERTICDCFKYRSRLDNEIFNKALNAYANDKKKNLNNLSEYAKKLRVYKRVTELMEVLLNG